MPENSPETEARRRRSVLWVVALSTAALVFDGYDLVVYGTYNSQTLTRLYVNNLIVQSGRVLLDREMDHPVVAEIREVIAALPESGNTQITDLHVWRVGNGAYACAISLLTHDPALTPLQIREALGIHEEIVHVTVEIHLCDIC